MNRLSYPSYNDKVNKTILTLDTKDSLNDNDRKLLEYNNLFKSELESKQRNFFNLKAKGSCIRARIKWVEEGDIPSKYFLNIEKQQQTGNVITKICDEGREIKNDQEILKTALKFYSNLYRKTNISVDTINEYLNKFNEVKSLNDNLDYARVHLQLKKCVKLLVI